MRIIKKFIYYAQLNILFSLFFIALFEKINLQLIISATFISTIVIIISEKYFVKNSYYNIFYFKFSTLFKYAFTLIAEIYKAGFIMALYIIKGKAKTSIIWIETDLKKSENITILANSITLTPGTISIAVSENKILVLWVNPRSSNSMIASDIIKGKLENVLRKESL